MAKAMTKKGAAAKVAKKKAAVKKTTAKRSPIKKPPVKPDAPISAKEWRLAQTALRGSFASMGAGWAKARDAREDAGDTFDAMGLGPEYRRFLRQADAFIESSDDLAAAIGALTYADVLENIQRAEEEYWTELKQEMGRKFLRVFLGDLKTNTQRD